MKNVFRQPVVRRILFFVLLCLLASSCARMHARDCQTGVANRSQRIACETAVGQRTGGDAFNVSPNIVVTGTSGFAIVMLAAMWWHLRRSRRTLHTVIRAVEDMAGPWTGEVKGQISREALNTRTADYLHRIVKTVERKPTTKA